ncbi:MAG: hypothetical protein A2537_02055 [Candidatus Magasanikbacteria bacterium RIFOXYD2_FULL_36_9]|uniref:EfeO-type cupredoxin-like domain-containing protein n=1 Tax=Candidatus Magasanikbacteria bacterium RIFOXYD2_FULL_36_9 TaxID=1798707 RepID=A0A1F6NYC9_9BACT|nr:MAG: hypothetical protein A2537_02055 [Candidatus Magasanikbacteria bacterium RIFOXYD2_FULL_36_9]
MTKYDISQPLKKGENIIIFTPTETGEIPFSCSMGMYTGKFVVVDKVSATKPVQQIVDNREVVAPVVSKTNNKVQLIKSLYTQIEDVSPNEFTVKKGQPVKWVIAMNEPPTGCMQNVVIRSIGVTQPMNTSGETVVEFTPTEAGDLWVTCSMGIHRATIHVV